MIDSAGYAQTVWIESDNNIVEAGMFVVYIDKDTLRQWAANGIPQADAATLTQHILNAYVDSGDP
jgi:hypothetical protein